MNPSLHTVILAAGKGTRMRSQLPKVLHQVGGAPMLEYVLRTAGHLDPQTMIVVLGHMAQRVSPILMRWNMVVPVVQEPQLGTAHALLQAEHALGSATGTLLLLPGDVPLLWSSTLKRLLEHHTATAAAATVLTARLADATGYGRIVRHEGRIARIVEHRDASPAERLIDEVNTSIYAFALEGLFPALHRVASDNAQGEYYLTDLIGLFRAEGRRVETFTSDDASEVRGINSRAELAEVNALIRDRRTAELLANGVTLVDPRSVWLGPDVEVDEDTLLHPNVYLEGRTRIGGRCEIQAGVRIIDSTLESDVLIQNYCVIRQSTIGQGAIVGPFAHIRPDSRVEAGAHVGNFVELKKTRLGRGSKANHLAYLGDATIGANVNVGAGTITCNYDGEKKHRTTIEDGVFVGSNSQLIAPVTIGAGAYVAAGSTITQDVPPGALAIARGRQENKPDWMQKRKAVKQS
jgi:bifunctional UDP-N-acetylglucosamine pyrophosphorylase / glucosamine-1-phosphate N-acetyltransferase